MAMNPMTERLYYTDSYKREFQARVVERSDDGRTVYLDRTLFYPTSGGQPFDAGSIGGVAVIEVVDEEERIAHRLAAPLAAEGEVAGEIDWARRFDHMQQHSGQHLLSAVFEELFGLHTVSFHLGAESATVDLEGGSVDARTVVEAERRANQVVAENRAMDVRFEDASTAQGLRKPSERAGTLRIVSIDGLDRSACGGTHVRTTGEIGPILLRRTEKIRQSVRVEFVCGGRAVRRARADFEALSRIAQLFSAPLDEVAPMVAAQLDAAAAFGVESPAFPFTVFTDRRGEVVALSLGELHKAQADLILGVVQTLNQDQVGLPEARRTIAAGLQALRGPSSG